jgi:hypothetical protein
LGSNIGMQQLFRLATGLSSPAVLIVVVWCVVLIAVATGPIDYSTQPSPAVLALVAAAISLFIVAHRAGVWCFGVWSKRQASVPAPSIRVLSDVIVVTSLAGIAGIGLMAFDRLVLSEVSNGGYAELLRCAPTLVDIIEIKRTPLLYAGYILFSFGFASLLLFLLKGDEIKGWPAALAQLSIISPVGYALLYSGRMPILFVIVLIVSAILVRIRQGRRPLPDKHHLVLKMTAVFLTFAVYSSAIWSTRQSFCIQMSGVIRELQHRMEQRELDRAAAPPLVQDDLNQQSRSAPRQREPLLAVGEVTDQGGRAGGVPQLPPLVSAKKEPVQTGQLPAADMINATDLNRMVDEARKSPPAPVASAEVDGLIAMLEQSWHVKPRAYVISAMDSGLLSPPAALGALGTYFYLTHGVRVLDTTWRAREQFSPQWGVYEVGILSPIFRVFFPNDQRLTGMDAQLKSAQIYGFFPTAWAAAYIDFGLSGAIIYIFIWGFSAGWSAFGARHSAFATPSLLLVFSLASIFLSPVQGPLGVANSALVLLSMIVTGLAVDLASLRGSSRREPGELKLGRSVT